MNHTWTYKSTLQLIDLWEKELKNYDLETLIKKPTDESWSLGQVYTHLISATLGYHSTQLETCLASTENASKRKNFKGFMVYNVLHSFPKIKIKVPASNAYTPKQPDSKEEIINGLYSVRKKIKISLALLEARGKQGKAPHPAFSYLNAGEWYKMVEMHFKHHLRQKADIDVFLKTNK